MQILNYAKTVFGRGSVPDSARELTSRFGIQGPRSPLLKWYPTFQTKVTPLDAPSKGPESSQLTVDGGCQVGATSCGESIRSLLASVPSSTADQSDHHHSSMFDRSPLTVWNASTTSSNPLWPSTSRRNLETILEAIRHLEGDHGQPTNLASRHDDVGQATSNSLSLAEALMASSNVQLTPTKTCVAVRSS